jgi:uncharacterized protein
MPNEDRPLHVAARFGLLDVVMALIDRKAAIDSRNKHFVTPLNVAILYSHEDLALLLLDHKADAEAASSAGNSLLHMAAEQGFDSLVDRIVHDKLVPINARDYQRNTPLYSALPRPLMVRKLLEHQADVTAANEQGKTALHVAIAKGHLQSICVLLECGADIEALDLQFNTPLHAAASIGDTQVIQALLDRKAFIDVSNNAKQTPLCLATSARLQACVAYLLANGASVNANHTQATKCSTPLHYATKNLDAEMIRLLLDNNAHINAANAQGNTPLHLAATQSAQVVEQLLGCNAIVNAANSLSQTPLHLALDRHFSRSMLARIPGTQSATLHQQRLQIVTALISNGASIDMRDVCLCTQCVHGCACRGCGCCYLTLTAIAVHSCGSAMDQQCWRAEACLPKKYCNCNHYVCAVTWLHRPFAVLIAA